MHKLVQGGKVVWLSCREHSLYTCLSACAGTVVTTPYLLQALHDTGAEINEDGVKVLVSRLRKKIGTEQVETVRQEGYLLRAPPTMTAAA